VDDAEPPRGRPLKAHELKRAKRDVRRAVLAARDALDPASRVAMAEVIAGRALATPEIAGARMVLAFSSFGSEVDTAPLIAGLRAAGTAVVLPRVDGPRLRLHVVEPGDELAPASFGALEPVGGAEVAPSALGAVVTPAVAFDRLGGRVGYGGGFYDRLFDEAPRVSRVGIAFAVQVVADPLPAGAFDRRVHVVVTESEVIRAPDLNRRSIMR
jgi:5-formyltetrahydrofolate cyclo-ligase